MAYVSQHTEARAHLDRGVAMARRVVVSDRGRRMVDGLALKGMERERYHAQGGTGMHSDIATRNWFHKQVRDRQRAFVRYAVSLGCDVRRAMRFARALASPFAWAFPDNTTRQACRWLNTLENRHARRAAESEALL